MRYLSVCSGMEAASVAWHPLGWTPVGFSEIEPFPCAILKHRFPNIPNYGSLTEYQSWPLEPGAIDLLVGGTPCQSFSVAGLRKGLADPRGNLALTFLGLADKLKPRWIVWENVPGVLSSGGGRDFGSFLGALVELGYGFAYRVLDAQHFGVPQRRRRVFVVAHLGDWRPAAEVLSLPEGVSGYLAQGKQKRKSPAADAPSSVGAGCWWDGGQVSQTLDAVLAKGQTMPEKNRFPAVLQPKPIDVDPHHFNQGENAQYEPHIGESEVMDSLVARGPHAVGVPFRKSKRAQSTTDDESWVEGEVSNTLNNFDLGDTRTTHAVVEPIAFTQNQRDEIRELGDKAGALSSSTGTHQTNYVAQPIAIQGTIIGPGENAGPQGTGATEGGPMFTLTKTDIHGVCHHMPGSVAPTIGASGPPYSRTGNERVEAEALAISFQPGNLARKAGADPSTESFPTLTKDSGDQSPHVCYPLKDPNDICCEAHRRQNGIGFDGDPAFTLRTAVTPGVATNMAVRRLTPVECERLQGFPDNWSRISWKGKPETECPDGPRYKACGNSMAVPVMRWIGERIAAVDSTLPPHA